MTFTFRTEKTDVSENPSINRGGGISSLPKRTTSTREENPTLWFVLPKQPTQAGV